MPERVVVGMSGGVDSSVAALLLKRAPAAARRADGTVPGMPLKQALASRTFLWLYAMCGFGAFSMFIPFAHLSAAARDLGVPDARAVGLVGLIGIGSLTGRFAIGALADRVGRPSTLILAQASLGASFIVWALADGYLALAAFALWMGTSYGGIVSLMPALCMDRFGARAVSSIIGTLYSAAAIGNLAGPWVAELEETWRAVQRELAGRLVSLDVTAVGYVDEVGKYLLALLRGSGSRVMASGTAMTDLVRRIENDWPVSRE
jgi:MFS family permease